MKTLLTTIFLIIFYTSLSAQNYVVETQTVYYYNQVIAGADANSFDVLYENQYFSKDKNHIYYKGKKTNYDVQTFEIHSDRKYVYEMISNKNDVYINNGEGVFIAIGSKSPNRFDIITDDIAIDNETIYWRYKPIYDSDVSSFQFIKNNIFKDKNKVYYEGHIMPINPSTIQLFKRNDMDVIEFIGDENSICNEYNYCYKMDVSSFKYINFNYVKDKSRVLYRTSYLKADVETFHVPIPELQHYAKDKNYQYYLDNTFPVKVDEKYLKPDTLRAFKVRLEEQLKKAFEDEVPLKYDKDSKESLSTLYVFPNSNNTIIEKGKNIYMNGLRQPFIDAESFEIFSNDYAKDKKQVYLIYEYDNRVTFNPIKEIDPKTFSIIENEYGAYCKDDKNVYHSLYLIKDADPKTFTVLSKDISEDKNAIYFEDKKVDNIKPTENTFLNKIEQNYFSFGNRIIYIDDFDILVDNPNHDYFKVLNASYALNGNQLIYQGRTVGTLSTEETIIKEDDEKVVTSAGRIFDYGQNLNTQKKDNRYNYLDTNYSTDGHTLYYNDIIEIKGVDLAHINHSGPYLQNFTFKNSKALYDDIVFDIDLDTFESLSSLHYARDKNFVYYDGKKTKLDPSTFYIHGAGYTSDKNGVYYNEILMPEADIDTFRVFGSYGFDDTYFYHNNMKILRSEVNFKL